jgi:Glycosyl hydrolase family 99
VLVRLRALFVSALVALVFTASAAAAPYRPVRIAAYYPWFPEGWIHAEIAPFTHYRPSLGFYDAGDPSVIDTHVRAMRWGHITAATYSWWGRGSATDSRLAQHLAIGARQRFAFAVYYELEGYADPSVDELRTDLEYLRDRYASSPGYLQLGGRFVVFVYGDADDGAACEVAQRWKAANAGIGAYVVLRSFRGGQACAEQPEGWHTYSANRYEFDLGRNAYAISPGFYFAKDSHPARTRHLSTWRRAVRRMARSPAQFHYVISYNEWGEGTAVESATQWASRSGYGRYLDVLHAVPGAP